VRRSAGAAKRTRAPRPPRSLSRRGVALAFALLALVLAYAYPVRVYLAQQAEIARLEAEQEEQRQRIKDLAEELSKWEDVEYVVAQARRRLYFVRPGETAYVIVDPAAPGLDGSGRSSADGPWVSRLWSNLQAADNPRAS
jgi:cell division protein FtsB